MLFLQGFVIQNPTYQHERYVRALKSYLFDQEEFYEKIKITIWLLCQATTKVFYLEICHLNELTQSTLVFL